MMLPIITADQRLAERRGIKGVLVGKSGIGKTSQLWTLNPIATLGWVVDMGFNLPRKARRRYWASRASCAA